MYLGAIYIFARSVFFGISFTLKAKKKLTGRVNCFHLWSLIFQIEHLYVGDLCELSAQQQDQSWGQGTAGDPCLVAVPCPSLRSCGWAESSLAQYSTIEIPSKTFILDSHRPFSCSAIKALEYVRRRQVVFTNFIFCLSMFRKDIFNCIQQVLRLT